MYRYNAKFLNYAAHVSRHSAEEIVSILQRSLAIDSVLDVGCAKGTWLNVWQKHGATRTHGVDGSYVDQTTLEIPRLSFSAIDLNRPFDLGRTFDLVQSLEVAEHLPRENSEQFVDSVCRHSGAYVLFSAAPPGQGGENHINERPYDFWRDLFAARGYVCVDAIRALILKDPTIPYWYRYNILLFVRESALPGVPDAMKLHLVPTNQRLKDVSPPPFRIRKVLVRCLPSILQNAIARTKALLLGGDLAV